MSKDIKNITENIMSKIDHGQIKMKPKAYFVAGSVITFIGLVFTIIFSTFLIGLIRFSLRTHGPMGQYRFDQMLSNFPWWTAIFAVMALILGISLIKHYDFSYKIKPVVLIAGFIIAIFIAGLITDMTGLNDNLSRQGPMKGMMRPHLELSARLEGPAHRL